MPDARLVGEISRIAGGCTDRSTSPTRSLPYEIRVVNVVFGGRGSISGQVTALGSPSDIPLRRRVRLHREREGIPVQEVWSDPVTGQYAFNGLQTGIKYTVIAYDYTQTYRAVAKDGVLAE
jgi:hypothetical protein